MQRSNNKSLFSLVMFQINTNLYILVTESVDSHVNIIQVVRVSVVIPALRHLVRLRTLAVLSIAGANTEH